MSIVLDEDSHSMDIAVSEEKLSQAIGRGGQNIRLASQLSGWDLNVMTESDAEAKSETEAKELVQNFMKQLDVDEDVATILAQEGFSTIEEIAYVPQAELAGIDEFDETIVAYMKRAYNLMIGERTAEEIKIRIGSAFPLEQELTMEVKGRDLSAGLPKTLTVRSEEIREALKEPLTSILESIRITLERCPPELSADLVDRGIVMAGGGSLLRGIDRLVAEETGLPVHIADDPLTAVAEGTGRVLQELQFLKRVASSSRT